MSAQRDQARVAHLLRRFGLGASEAEIDFYGKDGFAAAVDRLLDYEDMDEGFGIDPSVYANPDNGAINLRGYQLWWYLRLVTTRHPFEQKMTLFWHDHFATSAAKVDVGEAMYRHIETVRNFSTGKFSTLLTEVSKDPAMLYWLDNNENVKGTAQENFAREVMELFTLGVDNGYTEKDVQEAARALTGWTYGIRRGQRIVPTEKPNRNTQFQFVAARHDEGEKTIFGKSGPFDGDDVLQMLVDRPETAQYIVRKVWEWFVYKDPSKETVEEYAKKWQASGLDIKELVRAIAKSEEFYGERSMRHVVKNPVDFCVASFRSLGLGSAILDRISNAPDDQTRRRFAGAVAIVHQKTQAMGMELLYPPDVAGWVSGEEWISTATMVERIKWADVLFGPQNRGVMQLIAQNLPREGAQPKALVDRLLSVFDADLPREKVQTLYESAVSTSGGTVNGRNLQPTMQAVTRLIFGSPEFQFC
jgi:uncharacterized protein (DUF1800 family)